MNKGLLRLLSGFSENDWLMFRKFLDSPFFVNARNYKKIFEIIRNNRKDFSKITADYINNQLGESLNKSTLNTRFSELYKLAIKYLYYADAEKDTKTYYNGLLQSMSEKKLYKNALSIYSQVKDILIPKTLYDYNDYMKLLLSIGGINIAVNDLDRFYGYFEEYLNYSTVFALYTMLISTFSSVSLDHKAMAEKRDKYLKIFKLVNYEEIKKHFGNDPLFKPIIQIYYTLNAYIDDKDEANYEKAFNYFKENFESYSESWKGEIYLNLQSICVFIVQQGDRRYYTHYFNIIKHKIRNNQPVITEHNHYGFSEFHDIVNVAIVCKEYKWAESFINEYSLKLNPETRDMEIKNALASLYIFMKDYIKLTGLHRNINEQQINFSMQRFTFTKQLHAMNSARMMRWRKH